MAPPGAQDHDERDEEDPTEIAIVGMAGRFPGAPDIDTFWQNLEGGVESLRSVSPEELEATGVPERLRNDPRYVGRTSVLDDADCFDAAFFGYSPREATVIDPQQRIFLELAWQCLEHGGYRPDACDMPVGIFAGSAMNTFFLNTGLVPAFSDDYLPTLVGNDKDYLATRTAFKLNLRGPAMTVQTACSSSLVAVHMACQSLLNGECDMALAGGAAVRVPLLAGYLHEEGSVFSKSGHVRTFDRRADGTVFGSGAGAVLLKRLEDAEADGDCIHAVIRGSAVNNDGASKSEFTAPSLTAQADLVVEALAVAGVPVETISFIECHGTGTYLGDPIEVAALNRAFRTQTEAKQFCALGAVKSNIGHLDAAAGVAGLIKVVRAMQARALPPTVGFREPNPELELDDSPFYVNDKLREWNPPSGPLRAGVTALGIGGTNAHVILESAPEQEGAAPARTPRLVPLSAKSASSLDATCELLAKTAEGQQPEVHDVAHTLLRRQAGWNERRAVVAAEPDELIHGLRASGAGRVQDQALAGAQPVFLFSGQGSQHAGMGRAARALFPEFGRAFDAGLVELERLGRGEVAELLQAEPSDAVQTALARTENTQPALFVLEHALATHWQALGIAPAAMLGHSIGEYVAATVAGVFSFADALAIVCERGRLMQSMEPGAMLAVSATEAQLAGVLPDGVSIAVENGRETLAVGGPFAAIEALEATLTEKDWPHRRLHTSHAFHTAMMEPMLAPFREFVSQRDRHAPNLPFVSNVTGTWIQPEHAMDPQYWADHVRSTVRFRAGLETLLEGRAALAIEVGPGQALTSLARQAHAGDTFRAIASLPRADSDEDDGRHLLAAAGRVWAAGGALDWEALGEDPGRRVPLPGTAFDRTRHWPASAASDARTPESKPAERAQAFAPSWRRGEALDEHGGPEPSAATWLLVDGDGAVLSPLATELEAAGARVVRAQAGDVDWEALLRDASLPLDAPLQIVHGGLLGEAKATRRDAFETFGALFEAGESVRADGFSLLVLTRGAQAVGRSDAVDPNRAMADAACRSLVEEVPGTRVCSVDVDAGSDLANLWRCSDLDGGAPWALRDGYLWQRCFEAVSLEPASPPLGADQTLLVTGGLGGIGSGLACAWATPGGPTVVLVGRRAFPPKEVWDDAAALADYPEAVRDAARRFAECTGAGGRIEVIPADVTDPANVAALLADIDARCPTLAGVLHAAGTVVPGLLRMREAADLDAVLAPKVEGTAVLLDALRGRELSFVALFSSVLGLQAPGGHADYAAANAVLDAWSDAERELPVRTLDWPMWRGVGMAGEAAEERFSDYVELAEGFDCFAAALASGRRRLVISRRPADAIAQADTTAADAEAPAEGAPAIEALGNELEQSVGEIWATELGLARIAPEDNFLDLGGSSLLATRCLRIVRERHGVKVGIKAFFKDPTVRALAALVEAGGGKS
ncbi:MAG: beta-ketoacyl synthase N-terminal-like domain-containing protein [Myxococcota bacterium]